jgi:hypothetical protein
MRRNKRPKPNILPITGDWTCSGCGKSFNVFKDDMKSVFYPYIGKRLCKPCDNNEVTNEAN